MTKRLLIAVLAVVTSGGAAVAAPPASKDACLDQSFALAEKASKKKMAVEAQKKIEGMLATLEKKCVADDLAGAEEDVKAIEAAISAS